MFPVRSQSSCRGPINRETVSERCGGACPFHTNSVRRLPFPRLVVTRLNCSEPPPVSWAWEWVVTSQDVSTNKSLWGPWGLPSSLPEGRWRPAPITDLAALYKVISECSSRVRHAGGRHRARNLQVQVSVGKNGQGRFVSL